MSSAEYDGAFVKRVDNEGNVFRIMLPIGVKGDHEGAVLFMNMIKGSAEGFPFAPINRMADYLDIGITEHLAQVGVLAPVVDY